MTEKKSASKNKIKVVVPGESIRTYKLRGAYRENLEETIRDADVLFVLRHTRNQLQAMIVEGPGIITHANWLQWQRIDRCVAIMHQIMFCASASELATDYGYKAVTAIETQVTQCVNEPIGQSLCSSTIDYLMLRALETLNLTLHTVKKIQTWPADAQTNLTLAALAMCFVIDKHEYHKRLNEVAHSPREISETDQAIIDVASAPINREALDAFIKENWDAIKEQFAAISKSDRQAEDRSKRVHDPQGVTIVDITDAPSDDRVKELLAKKQQRIDTIFDPMKPLPPEYLIDKDSWGKSGPEINPKLNSEDMITDGKVYVDYETQGVPIQAVTDAAGDAFRLLTERYRVKVNAVYRTATCVVVEDNKYQIMVLPHEKKISKKRASIHLAWKDAAERIEAEMPRPLPAELPTTTDSMGETPLPLG